MLLTSLTADPETFHTATGWEAKPEGMCRGDVCVPVANALTSEGLLDVKSTAAALAMPIVQDVKNARWAVGPSTLNGRALPSATLPNLILEDRNGNPFRLDALHGRRTLLVAWASW